MNFKKLFDIFKKNYKNELVKSGPHLYDINFIIK